jgi:hypothetical protein
MSVREPKLTQEQIEQYVADEPDRMPFGGAGSMAGHARRASKQYRPSNGRARLTAAERQQFAAQFQEVTPMSPEEEQRIQPNVVSHDKQNVPIAPLRYAEFLREHHEVR